MNQNDFKAWYQSLGVWGSLGTIVVGLLDALKIAHGDGIEQSLNQWSVAAGIVITGLISFYGRIRATQQIALKKPDVSSDAEGNAINATAPGLATLQQAAPAKTVYGYIAPDGALKTLPPGIYRFHTPAPAASNPPAPSPSTLEMK